MEIFSDSSLMGWGYYCDGVKAFGFWDENERKKHINYLELLAAFFAIKCFASKLSNCEILLRLDNTTAIAYVNRAGGVRFRHLSMLSKKDLEMVRRTRFMAESVLYSVCREH
ncbi:GSCOCG00011219001-RA-CDS [Cotesia congregata]|nr:GSCOCG00011219001-RA-CDS [Cotesia congregata]